MFLVIFKNRNKRNCNGNKYNENVSGEFPKKTIQGNWELKLKVNKAWFCTEEKQNK